jgi:glycosyltransferase involved in cell wall biosynthesis
MQNSLAIVVVTYKRQELLTTLFDSLLDQNKLPAHIVIVDNENSHATKTLVEDLNANLEFTRLHYLPQDENLGGAGGFSKGVEFAFNLGVQWLWLMDDDVKMLPNAVEKLEPWLETAVEKEHRVLQVRRLNFDNSEFYWQYHFVLSLGIPNPFAPSAFGAYEKSRDMNTACFEGGVFHRSIVSENGLPDPRFFIYWDDTVYGYLASKITNPLLINDICLQRTRALEHIKLGTVRKLNSTSDVTRYYIMRNRGFIAQYFKIKGDYNAFMFALGTALTFVKEFIRLFITKSVRTGFPRLVAGLRDGRKIRKDKGFRPMPPLLK